MAINNVNAANFAVLRSGTSGTTGTMDFSGSTVKGAGLDLITPTSIANSGGSASASGGAVTFTGVNSISVNGVFTSTYANYRLVMDWRTSSSNGAITFRYRASGTDDSTSNYNRRTFYLSGTLSTGVTSSGTSIPEMGYGYSGEASQVFVDFTNPQATQRTLSFSYDSHGTGANTESYVTTSQFAATTSFDGFTVFQAGSNVLTGTLRVYGYRNS
jgi:hypothetical protein